MPEPLAGVRIGFDLRRMWKTGIGRYGRALIGALPQALPGADFFAVVNSEDDGEYLATTTPAVRAIIAPAAQYSPAEIICLPKIEQKLDLWHSPHPYQLGLGAQVPVVLSILDLIQVHHAMGARNQLVKVPLRTLMDWSTKRAAHLVAISAATADAFVDEFGLTRHKLSITPLAADDQLRLDATAEDVDSVLRCVGGNDPFILYVGMLQPHKNLLRLIDALSLIREDIPHTLLVIGQVDGQASGRLLEYAAARGLRSRVRILVNASDGQLAAAYTGSDLLVLPSLQEGFGLPLVEAMRFGTPCAVSALPVMREVAGDAACYFDPFDHRDIARAIAMTLVNEEQRCALSAAGRERAARFSWSITARLTVDAYRIALGMRP